MVVLQLEPICAYRQYRPATEGQARRTCCKQLRRGHGDIKAHYQRRFGSDQRMFTVSDNVFIVEGLQHCPQRAIRVLR